MATLYTEDTDAKVWAVFPTRPDLASPGVRIYADAHSAELAANFGAYDRYFSVVEMPVKVCSLEGWPDENPLP